MDTGLAAQGFFTRVIHIAAPFAFLAIAAKFFGGIALIFAFLTRIARVGILSNMLIAIALVHHKFGLFMNWTGLQKGKGCEYHLLRARFSRLPYHSRMCTILQDSKPINRAQVASAATGSWKQECPDPKPETFIFPNPCKRHGATGNGFISTDNYRALVLKNLAGELGCRS